MKVSWQVTGIRKDRWAKKNRIVVEERKSSKDRGRYLDPALYGQPKEKGLHAVQRPDMAQLMKKARRVMKARKATSVPLPTKSPLSANVRKRK